MDKELKRLKTFSTIEFVCGPNAQGGESVIRRIRRKRRRGERNSEENEVVGWQKTWKD